MKINFLKNIISQTYTYGFIERISSLEFWLGMIDRFTLLGPFAPILIMIIEAIIPALPLFAIVTLNVASHGPIFGFVYSLIGAVLGSCIVFLFWRKIGTKLFVKLENKSDKIHKAKVWVSNFRKERLFVLLMFPFTPSSFFNFAFGVSDFDAKTYICTLTIAKIVMIGMLVGFGQSVVKAFEKPVLLIIALIIMVVLWFISDVLNKKNGLK